MEKKKVLIVEDDVVASMDLKKRLLRLGYNVIGSFKRGEDAIEHFSELQPDIVLMDIILDGEIDGIETASQIHKKYEIPVIFLTSMIDEDTFQRAKITEPYAYIIKPTMDRELQINIEIALYKGNIEKERNELLRKLKEQTDKIKELSGLIPICASCKKIRNDDGYWFQVEEYIRQHTQAEFTHSLCPTCMKKLYPDYMHDEEDK
ncbi:MAG TPA: response regulator [Candidatus Cloacimonadota bacterium]|nr:response regulator [Candidatus Cloacimonadota bacterium]